MHTNKGYVDTLRGLVSARDIAMTASIIVITAATARLSNPSLRQVGYGDITPTNDVERAYAVCLALAGALVFAFCIGSISSLASQGNVTEQIIEEEMHGLTDFLRYSSTPRKLQHKLRLQLFYSTKKAPHLTHNILNSLPRCLQSEMIDHLMIDWRGFPFFTEMDTDCRVRILQLLRPFALEKGEYVYQVRILKFILKSYCEINRRTSIRCATPTFSTLLWSIIRQAPTCSPDQSPPRPGPGLRCSSVAQPLAPSPFPGS